MSMFLDYAKVFVKAGKGGDGMVAFRREKYVPDGGPAGGDGGNGGSVIFRVDEGLRTLMDFRYNRIFKGKNGENGMSKSMFGKGAKDTYVNVPAGTIVRNAQTNAVIADMTEKNQEVVIAKGGRGGRGNKRFATHKNPAPEVAENGESGEELEVILELKVLADVGLVGFPSVGKSTLLSVVSSAKPKIAEYHFTTIVPNLGMVSVPHTSEQFVMADLPGLIEGASSGVGLGIQFLKHIERTRVILHVIDMASIEGRDPFDDYEKINHELSTYQLRLLERPTIIVANKMDMPQAQENLIVFKQKLNEIYSDKQIDIVEISAWQSKGVEELLLKTYSLLEETDPFPLFEDEVVLEENIVYTLEQEQPFTITRDDDAIWVLSGEKLEKLFDMTNFSHDESIMRFARQLRSMGIDEALREKGAVSGDTVRIKSFEFEFVD
ncbi:GTPase ObgE [Carnobacteriaceae bacterium zg-84]|uniref:GTPase ObgE n=1 Tax=Granulicatella sp. zg-84 TaxID=2678503 RepID=UPI0013D5580E|nr:GTPase ObgE [Granulicatella sp. zg-84]QMI86509.1 GTPase ObgE [Carnobacteriaceae bacterium zg-84]